MEVLARMWLRVGPRSIPLLMLALATVNVIAQQAAAADFYVNSVADKIDSSPGDGKCSTGGTVDGKTPECTLRAAIDEVNALSKSSPTKKYSIALQAGVYSLTTSEVCTYYEPADSNVLTRSSTSFCINANLTITGDSAATSIIDGGSASRLFVIGPSSIVAINQVTMQNSVNDGDEFDGGGAVANNEGTLSLTGDVVTQNSANVSGRVIFNAATLVVDDCVFEGNIGTPVASAGFDGLNDTSINSSYFYNNTALEGAAVSAFDGARLRISDSTITGNTVAGNGIVSVNDTAATITNSTISFNIIQNTGTIVSNGNGTALTLNNDTIYGNTASNAIGGLYTDRAVISNTIISNNGATDCSADILVDLGHNIIGSVTSGSANLCKTGALTAIGVDPKLGPLRLYGGAVATQNPMAGSPAIGQGSPLTPGGNASGACAALDERGAPRGVNGPCTIGATEALSGLHVTAILPTKGGVGGMVTATVDGSGFVSGSSLTLQKGSVVISAVQTEISIDATAIAATFSLTNALPGLYDVVVKTPTATASLPAAFTVQSNAVPNLYAYVTGETAGREGLPNSFTLVYGNTGNVDAYLVPATVSLPGNFASSFSITSPPVATGQAIHDWSNVPVQVTPFSVNASVNVPLIIPIIPAGSEGILRFITAPPIGASTTASYNLYASLGDPYGTGIGGGLSAASLDQFVVGATSYAQSHLGAALNAAQIAKMSTYAATQLANVIDGGEQALLRTQGGSPIFYSNAQLTIDVAAYGASIADKSTAAVKAKKAIALVTAADSDPPSAPVVDCGGGAMVPGSSCTPKTTVVPPPDPKNDDPTTIPPSDCTSALHHHISQDGTLCVPDNPKGCPIINSPFTTDPFCGNFKIRGSLDPNQKNGPLGIDDVHYVATPNSFSYLIEFENSAVATGAAQKVVVTDTLDSSRFDLSTLQLGPISFGPYVVSPPPGLTTFTAALDLRPDQNVIVSIRANLDKTTGTLNWLFTSLDPATLQATTDANAGFLPPDTAPPAGIGHVSFKVGLLPNVKDGQICNVASIVFDTNAALNTAPFCNVKDTTAPVSHVLPLPATTASPNFVVSWNGTDSGSGISVYSVFVSDNSQPFQLLITTAATSSPFAGQIGHQYGFYTIATDRLGNVEAAKTSAEATISVGSAATATVPNVVGMPQSNAASALTSAGLTLGSITLQSSAAVAAGSVISESPVAGTKVALKSVVNLIVSSGPAAASVPNVVGLTQAAASTAIINSGLVVGSVTTQASTTISVGSVISESPVSGSKVTAKSAVNLVVSSGPAPVSVPNVVGLSQAVASTTITKAGLVVGSVSIQSSASIGKGIVISESPVSGTRVAANTPVALVVSSGRLLGDVNGDGVVSCADLVLVKAAFGSKVGQPAYNINADVNSDGVVNIVDLSIVAAALPAGTKCN